jgi:hypothetical protein
MEKLDKQIVGNAGLYYTCYKLSCLGWNVMPTARNAKGVDIVAYNQSGSRFIGIQVKALAKRNPVPLGTSFDKIMGDFWVILYDVGDKPKVFVLKPEEIKDRAIRREKEGKVSCWLETSSYEVEDFREAWHRIGKGDIV